MGSGDSFNGNGNGVDQRAGQMRLAGVLFIIGSVFGLPSTLILSESTPWEIFPLTALGIASGLTCLSLPWEWLSPRWIHAVLVAGIAEVSLITAMVDFAFLVYFVIIAVFVSYIFSSRRVIEIYLGLISLAVAALAIGYLGEEEAAAQLALLTIPTVVVSATMIAYLREQQEASRRKYQRFAQEAMELAERLHGGPISGGPAGAAGPGAPASAHASPVPPVGPGWPTARRIGLALGAALLALPLGIASLAAAGVHLPGVATAPFEELGITLPNQESDAAESTSDPATASAESDRASGGWASGDGPHDAEAGNGGSGRTVAGTPTAAAGGDPEGPDGGAQAPAAPSAPIVAPPPARPADRGPSTDRDPLEEATNPIDEVLRDTLDLLDQTLPRRAQEDELRRELDDLDALVGGADGERSLRSPEGLVGLDLEGLSPQALEDRVELALGRD
jgi:hypothetical protein